jgi:two-component system cell cycle sensor histidine kinase/response regulator CckA
MHQRIDRILIVEDVELDAELIETELHRAKIPFESRRAENRAQFIHEIHAFQPDLILSDYTLPQFNVLNALELLQSEHKDIPLILVTGHHSEEIAVECMKRGAQDYILKASLRRLPMAVLNALEKRRFEAEKANAELAFRRREEQYRLITENTRDLIALMDLDYHFLYVSPSHQRVLGQDPEAMLAKSYEEWVHPSDVKALRRTFEEALFFREGCNVEIRWRMQNNKWQSFETTGNWIFDERGQPQRALLVSRDISERKRAEIEIERLAAFPRYNPHPVWAFAADGNLIYFNDAVVALTRALGKTHPREVLPLNITTIVKMCLSTGQSKIRMDTTMGRRTLSWSFAPIVPHQVVYSWSEDVTDRLNLENQLRQSSKMESVGQLAAGIAHDFNNILTIIQGHAQLLLSTAKLENRANDSVKQISLAADRAANLTRQLLMFSRKQAMQPQLMNLNEVVQNITKMLRSLVGDQVALQFDRARQLPIINADPGMMEQILVNLAANARDAMPRGGSITITTKSVDIDASYVTRHPEAHPGSYVCLSVTDTGCGMTPETLSHIFEPFFTTKEVGKGTGLGLATVYGIVKQHEGWVEVSSDLDVGTTFRLYLPICAQATSASETMMEPSQALGGEETILVVEDEGSLRDLVKEILQSYGYRVLEASSGTEALQVWDQHKDEVDLLFTDMMMPEGVSGRELAQRLSADKPTLRVIFTSGYSVDVVATDFNFREGVNFLQKPYLPETLAQTIRNCLDHKEKLSAF